MEPLNEAVEKEVREFFTNLGRIPADQLVANACDRKAEVLQVAYRQAVSDFEKTQKQVSALEAEAVKALTGECQLDLSVVNGMLLKLRAQLDKEGQAVEETRAKVEADEKNRKATEAQVEQLLTWGEKYDAASFEARHLIISALVDRVEVNKNYEVKVFFASPFWRKLQNIFGGCCSSKLEEVAAIHHGHGRGTGYLRETPRP